MTPECHSLTLEQISSHELKNDRKTAFMISSQELVGLAVIPGKALVGVALAVVVDAETALALTLVAVNGTVVVVVV